MISYAQNFEDVMLERVFRDQAVGFYIDIGVWHSTNDSVTKHFYDRGWSGINVEPLPDNYREVAAARGRDINLQVAVTTTVGSVVFNRVRGTGLSTLHEEIAARHAAGFEVDKLTVATTTLRQICEQHVGRRQIDFLKIDVEGAEVDVIASGDWVNHRPRVVVVEATVPGSPIQSCEGWDPALQSAGYVFCYFDGLNRWYTRQEEPSLRAAFHAPPNPFDGYTLASVEALQQRVDKLEKRLASAMKKADRYDSIGQSLIGKLLVRLRPR